MNGPPAYDPAAPRVGGWALALRIAAVSAPPALMALWLALPPLHPPPLRLAGPVTAERVCVGPWCREVVAVAGQKLACRADFIGLPEDCRLRGAQARGLPSAVLVPGEPAEARAIALPSLLSLLGRAPTEAVLLELRQGGRVLFSRPLQAQAWAALYGGWLFHAVYWPIAGLLLWLWPASGLSRRLWARITWQAPPR